MCYISQDDDINKLYYLDINALVKMADKDGCLSFCHINYDDEGYPFIEDAGEGVYVNGEIVRLIKEDMGTFSVKLVSLGDVDLPSFQLSLAEFQVCSKKYNKPKHNI